MRLLRVLVVDDSTIFRKILRDALAETPGVELVGTAFNAWMALEKIQRFGPDILLLDVDVPATGGLDLLSELRESSRGPSVIAITSDKTGKMAAESLRRGADHVIGRPCGSNLRDNMFRVRKDLQPIFERLRCRCEEAPARPEPMAPPRAKSKPHWFPGFKNSVRAVAIGVSTGGPRALAKVLPQLPADLPMPVFITLHMPPRFTASLAEELDGSSRLRVFEARDGQLVRPGEAYLAPGGMQMKVVKNNGQPVIHVNHDPPEGNCRPSVNYLFRSIAHTYGAESLAIVMTGMGDDGALGARLLKHHGAVIAAQDEKSSVIYGMPRQVIEAGIVDVVFPLDELHALIIRAAGRLPKLAAT